MCKYVKINGIFQALKVIRHGIIFQGKSFPNTRSFIINVLTKGGQYD